MKRAGSYERRCVKAWGRAKVEPGGALAGQASECPRGGP